MPFSSESRSADRRGRGGAFFGVSGFDSGLGFKGLGFRGLGFRIRVRSQQFSSLLHMSGFGKGLVLAFCRDTRPGLTAKWARVSLCVCVC